MKRMRAAREARNLPERRKGGPTWGGGGENMRNGHRSEQRNSVKEGANEKVSRAQRTLCEAADSHSFMSFLCATHKFLLSWLEMNLLEVGTPTARKKWIYYRVVPTATNGHSGQRGKASQQPSRATAQRGSGRTGSLLTFTSAEGKAQLDSHLWTAKFTLKHGRNINHPKWWKFSELNDVFWDLLEAEARLCLWWGSE